MNAVDAATGRRALSFALAAARPDWDQHGILVWLDRDRRPLLELGVVAFLAAADPGARTPAVIPHRHAPVAAGLPKPSTTDDRVMAGLALAAQLQEQEDRERTAQVALPAVVLAEDQVLDVPEGAARMAYVAACRSALAEGRPEPAPLRRPSDQPAFVDDTPAATA